MTVSLGELKARAASLAESADDDDRAEAAMLFALIAVAEAARPGAAILPMLARLLRAHGEDEAARHVDGFGEELVAALSSTLDEQEQEG